MPSTLESKHSQSKASPAAQQIAERNLRIYMDGEIIHTSDDGKLSAHVTIETPEAFEQLNRDMKALGFSHDSRSGHGTANDYFDSYHRGDYGVSGRRGCELPMHGTIEIQSDENSVTVSDLQKAIAKAPGQNTLQVDDAYSGQEVKFPLKIELEAPIVERFLALENKGKNHTADSYVGRLR